MSLEPAPVLLLTSIIAATVGTLLVFAYLQSRNHVTLLIWGCADLVAAVAAVLLVLRNAVPDSLSVVVPMGLLACAYSAIWAACRSFARRRPIPLGMAVGPLAWCVACACPAILQSTERRVLVSSVIIASYTLAAAGELWRDRREPLLSRYPLVACLVAHATMVVARGVLALSTPMPDTAEVLTHPWAGIMALEPAILVIALGFLQLSMAMESSELVQRRAAMTDALTGVASRRAFIDQGEQRLAAATRTMAPVALLLFDLDHFKAINDSFGHEAGDDVLRAFAARVEPLLGAGALFGRLGGEEFAAVLIGATAEAALAIAERCRAAVERFSLHQGFSLHQEGAGPALSVSVGVAAAQGPRNLDALLREADLALYCAKSAGRNGVKLNPPQPSRLPQAA
jgi:diguanylate cyclase (GGDEF)-like protein